MGWKQYPSVTLPSDIIERCRRHGRQMSIDLLHPQNHWNAMSASVSSHSAEKNVALLGRSKMAECSFCRWADIDIERLHWGRIPDGGFDVFWMSMRIDIKHSAHPDARYCIWPINKTKLFDGKQFDVIVQVLGVEPTFTLQGWIKKSQFRMLRKIAKDIHGVDDGTRYVDTEHLQRCLSTMLRRSHRLCGKTTSS
jgi:hypothetical protein